MTIKNGIVSLSHYIRERDLGLMSSVARENNFFSTAYERRTGIVPLLRTEQAVMLNSYFDVSRYILVMEQVLPDHEKHNWVNAFGRGLG